VLAFIFGFWLLRTPISKLSNFKHVVSKVEPFQISNFLIAILFCAVLGVLLNNLIDYAIFEPGVYTTFWAIVACLIATSPSIVHRPSSIVYHPPSLVKVISIVAGVFILIVFVRYAWWPVYKSTAKIQQANRALSIGQYQQAHALLTEAAQCDQLDWTALNLNGKLYLQQYGEAGQKQTELLKNAEVCFKQAIDRNKIMRS
jgi:tetratricopeptide (TPR) repeat protein